MNYKFKKIQYDDYYHGHLDLYKQLTSIDPKKITYNDYVNFIDNLNDEHMVFVLCHDKTVIGSITLFIEQKLIHNLGKVGHIEDVVIDEKYRGQGLGKILLENVVNYCKNMSCYKIILDCSKNNVGFYEKCNFEEKGSQMAFYF